MKAAVDGDEIRLNKFASMGSALCFPIESMVFFTLLVLSEIRRHNLPISSRTVDKCRSAVFVYGDDLIIPTDAASDACSILEAFGLKVNAKKSFWTGKFRESCGMDAYAGVDVTPVYIRHKPPASIREVTPVVSLVAAANHFYRKGWWRAAQLLRDMIETKTGPLPYVGETASCLGWLSVRYGNSLQGWDPETHTPVVRSYVVGTKQIADPLEGYPALMKYFLQRPSSALPRGMNLVSRVDTANPTLKRRWTRPY
jgi:hypothetical protein